MCITTIEILTKLDDNCSKRFPEIEYEGCIPEDADEMDYVTTTTKGAIIV